MGYDDSDRRGPGETAASAAASEATAAPAPAGATVGVPEAAPAGATVGAAAVKFLIAGGFGVGKTTMVGALSEVAPLRTEEYLTVAGVGVDDVAGVGEKATTTVAMDFGRITIDPGLVVYLFGTPGQDRFWFMWDDLVVGALGAVVIVDTRRLPSSFAAIDFFESRGIPFVIAVNCFDGRQDRTVAEVRDALDLDPRVPVLLADLRSRPASRDVLLNLVDHLMAGYYC